MEKRKHKIFLDSNVILSGLFSDKGSPRLILDLLSLNLPFLLGITGQYNLIEIERNLKKKMADVLPVYKEYLPKLGLEIVPLPPKKRVKELAGHVSDKDIPVLASAVMGNVDFLVTGGKKSFKDISRKTGYLFKIVSPSEFLEISLPQILKSLEP